MEELTLQQKLWKGAGVFWYSAKPLLLYLCFPALLMCFGMMLFGGRDTQAILSQSSNFYYALGILLTLAVLHGRSKRRGSSLFKDAALEWRGLSFKRLLLLLAAGFGAAVFFSALITLLPFPEALSGAYHASSSKVLSGTDQAVAMLSVVFFAPVAEEVIFRGYMLGRLLSWFTCGQAVAVSALVFALCHVSILWMAYAGLLGLALGWVSLREDNTVYSIALHVGFNLSVLPTSLINGKAGLKELFFGSPVKIFGLGALAGFLALWAYRRYQKEEIV